MYLLYRALGIASIIGALILPFVDLEGLLLEIIGLAVIGILLLIISSLARTVKSLEYLLIQSRYAEDFLESIINRAGKYRIRGEGIKDSDTLYAIPKLKGSYLIPIEAISEYTKIEGTSLQITLPHQEPYTFSIRQINLADPALILIEVYKELYINVSSIGLKVELGRGKAVVSRATS